MDFVRLQRGFIILVLFVVVVISAGRGAAASNIVAGLLLPMAGLALVMVGKPWVLLIWIYFAEVAKLVIPGMPGALGVSEFLQIGVIAWAILDAALIKRSGAGAFEPRSDLWMVLFLANIIFTMFMRGFGFRIMGQGTYGGSGYLMLLLSIFFYFSAIKIDLPDGYARKLMIISLVAALIPVVVDILIVSSAGQLKFLLQYVRTAAGGLLKEAEAESGMERWGSFGQVATALIPIAFLLVRRKFLRYGLLAVAFVLVAYTGFRSRIFMVACLTGTSALYFSRDRLRTALLGAGLVLALWAVLIAGAGLLPKSVQRSVSFVPFVEVESAVLRRAEGSTEWRIQMWKDYCIPNVPQYLWVGRGIAQNIMDFAYLQQSWYKGAEFFYFMGGYHSGPFSLILDWGVVGTVSFTVFFLIVTLDAWRVVRRYCRPGGSLVSRYYAYLTILMTFEIVSYYLIFGSVRSGLFRMLMIAVQLRIFRRNIIKAHGHESVVEPAADVNAGSAFSVVPRHGIPG